MGQSTFSVRMEEKLKKQFEELCNNFGMNMSTAINVFARAVVKERKIPFEISENKIDITRDEALNTIKTIRAKAELDGISDMPLEEINREIDKTRHKK